MHWSLSGLYRRRRKRRSRWASSETCRPTSSQALLFYMEMIHAHARGPTSWIPLFDMERLPAPDAIYFRPERTPQQSQATKQGPAPPGDKDDLSSRNKNDSPEKQSKLELCHRCDLHVCFLWLVRTRKHASRQRSRSWCHRQMLPELSSRSQGKQKGH